MGAWAVCDKIKSWDAVCDRAWAGEPQFIMRGVKQTVVVISFGEYQASQKNKPNAVLDALRSCPCNSDEFADLVDKREPEMSSFFERTGGFGEV